MSNKTGEIRVCGVCGSSTYKTKSDIEKNRRGLFFCSVDCFMVGSDNYNLAKKIENEWRASNKSLCRC